MVQVQQVFSLEQGRKLVVKLGVNFSAFFIKLEDFELLKKVFCSGRSKGLMKIYLESILGYRAST